MSPWKVILATIIIFGSGVVTGALLIRGMQQHHPKPSTAPHNSINRSSNAPAWQLQRADFLRKIEKSLNLSVDQQQRIEKIMHDSQERTKPLWETIAPQMQAEMKQVRESIRAELNPDQQKKFEELLKPRAEEKRHRKEPAPIPASPAPVKQDSPQNDPAPKP